MFAMMGLSLLLPGDWFKPLYRYAHDLYWKFYPKLTFGLSHQDYFLAAQVVLFTSLFTIPEFLVATTGGLLARRFARLGPPGAWCQR